MRIAVLLILVLLSDAPSVRHAERFVGVGTDEISNFRSDDPRSHAAAFVPNFIRFHRSRTAVRHD